MQLTLGKPPRLDHRHIEIDLRKAVAGLETIDVKGVIGHDAIPLAKRKLSQQLGARKEGLMAKDIAFPNLLEGTIGERPAPVLRPGPAVDEIEACRDIEAGQGMGIKETVARIHEKDPLPSGLLDPLVHRRIDPLTAILQHAHGQGRKILQHRRGLVRGMSIDDQQFEVPAGLGSNAFQGAPQAISVVPRDRDDGKGRRVRITGARSSPGLLNEALRHVQKTPPRFRTALAQGGDGLPLARFATLCPRFRPRCGPLAQMPRQGHRIPHREIDRMGGRLLQMDGQVAEDQPLSNGLAILHHGAPALESRRVNHAQGSPHQLPLFRAIEKTEEVHAVVDPFALDRLKQLIDVAAAAVVTQGPGEDDRHRQSFCLEAGEGLDHQDVVFVFPELVGDEEKMPGQAVLAHHSLGILPQGIRAGISTESPHLEAGLSDRVVLAKIFPSAFAAEHDRSAGRSAAEALVPLGDFLRGKELRQEAVLQVGNPGSPHHARPLATRPQGKDEVDVMLSGNRLQSHLPRPPRGALAVFMRGLWRCLSTPPAASIFPPRRHPLAWLAPFSSAGAFRRLARPWGVRSLRGGVVIEENLGDPRTLLQQGRLAAVVFDDHQFDGPLPLFSEEIDEVLEINLPAVPRGPGIPINSDLESFFHHPQGSF